VRLAELNKQAEGPDFWNDPERAQRLMQERNALEDQLTSIGRLERELDDQLMLIELGESENDEKVVAEAEAAISALRAEASRREVEALLSGEADNNDTFLEVHAGAGGTESQDWASMLLRMYARWAEQHDYKIEFMEETPGEEAGIKSATLQIKGATLTAGRRRRRGCIGWCASRRSIPMRGVTRRSPAFRSIR
jgi:peptide chain release factor 2